MYNLPAWSMPGENIFRHKEIDAWEGDGVSDSERGGGRYTPEGIDHSREITSGIVCDFKEHTKDQIVVGINTNCCCRLSLAFWKVMIICHNFRIPERCAIVSFGLVPRGTISPWIMSRIKIGVSGTWFLWRAHPALSDKLKMCTRLANGILFSKSSLIR